MKKIILSTVAIASLVMANEYKYEVTPMFGYVDTKKSVDIANHKVGGISFSINKDDECKFDQLELGILHTKGAEYDNSTLDTDITRLFINAIKDYKINDKFKLYALVGLGHENIENTITGNSDDQFFNYGVGFKYAINETLSLRVDARHLLKFDGDQNILYTVGLSIPFGKKANKIVDLDSDNDGVLDSIDQCPTTPVGEKVDATGCTVVLDGDNDGVIDANDNCPTTKAGIKVNASGCELDSDNDGVLDSIDKCPTTSMGTKVDTSGCEVLNKPADLGIVFETNSDKIKSSDLAKFDKYVKYLSVISSAQVVLEAHTDSVGSAKYNLKLSQKRANSAKKQLVSMGIESHRIEAIGYGETKPLVENNTKENRQINRRVTARIVK